MTESEHPVKIKTARGQEAARPRNDQKQVLGVSRALSFVSTVSLFAIFGFILFSFLLLSLSLSSPGRTTATAVHHGALATQKIIDALRAPRVSQVAQVLKNLPAVQETWVGSQDQADPWRRTWQPTRYSCLGNPVNRGAQRATVQGVTKSNMTEKLTLSHFREPMNTFLGRLRLTLIGPDWVKYLPLDQSTVASRQDFVV